MDTQTLIRPAARGGKYLGPDAARVLPATKQHASAVVFLTDTATGQLAAWNFVYTDGKEAGPANLMDPVRRSEAYAVDAETVGVTLTVSIDKPTLSRSAFLARSATSARGARRRLPSPCCRV